MVENWNYNFADLTGLFQVAFWGAIILGVLLVVRKKPTVRICVKETINLIAKVAILSAIYYAVCVGLALTGIAIEKAPSLENDLLGILLIVSLVSIIFFIFSKTMRNWDFLKLTDAEKKLSDEDWKYWKSEIKRILRIKRQVKT